MWDECEKTLCKKHTLQWLLNKKWLSLWWLWLEIIILGENNEQWWLNRTKKKYLTNHKVCHDFYDKNDLIARQTNDDSNDSTILVQLPQPGRMLKHEHSCVSVKIDIAINPKNVLLNLNFDMNFDIKS